MARQQKPKKEKRSRVNMRMPSELVEWVKQYAKARNKTLTQVIVDVLTDLQAEETA